MSDTPTAFVVIAEFSLDEGALDSFLSHAFEDAQRSLADEPGCHHFDVLRSEDDPATVVLHEVYSDRAAFDAHQQMPHYAPFKESTAPLLAAEPKVRCFTQVFRD